MMMLMMFSARRVFPAVTMVDRLPRAVKYREPGKVASKGVGKNLFFEGRKGVRLQDLADRF